METIIPFKQLAEQAVSEPTTKQLSGQLKSYDELLRPETINAIDAAHGGVYGILAFDEKLDTHIAQYISSGGLAKDSTDQLLILYASGPVAEPERSGLHPLGEISGFQFQGETNASYEFIRSAFRGGKSPRLPGVLFMSRLATDVEAVFLSAFETASLKEARSVLAEGFRQASIISGGPHGEFAEKLSRSFARSPLLNRYHRTGSMSASESLIKFWRCLLSQRKDIMSAIKIIF